MARDMAVGKKHGQEFISPRVQQQLRRDFIFRDIRRKMVANGEIESQPPSIWEWKYGGKYGSVKAHTKSEARAAMKKVLKLSKGKPLPRGITIQKVAFE